MTKEIEIRVLDVNPDQLSKRIVELGGQEIFSGIQKRHVYDVYPNNKNKWIRLRDNGKSVSLAVKEVVNANSAEGTLEHEITVDNFARTNELLQQLGFQSRSYQENKRTAYKFYDVELAIDEWPKLKPFLEVEGPSEDRVYKVARLLGFKKSDTSLKTPTELYGKLGIDVKTISRLTF